MTRPVKCACGRYIKPLGWASHRKNCAQYQAGFREFFDAALPPANDLRAAAQEAADYLAELYAKYQSRIGPFATQAQRINGRLRAALAPGVLGTPNTKGGGDA
jgi:hypothetical protein